jgi:hypothetical protein
VSDGSLFFAIKSVDEEQRLVYGRATEETLDRQGEILDYDASKPLWEEWIAETQEASGGKSMGNVRVMHRPDIAAGKLTRVDFNDDEKAIDVCAKVVDDAEWAKVLEGVYTGFSQGGKYISKKTDYSVKGIGGMPAVRVVIAPKELSLVDRPAVPTANFFEVVKCDGTKEQRSFKGGDMSDDATKGLWEARDFIAVIQQLKFLHDQIGEGGAVGPEIREKIRELGQLALAYLAEELGEHIGLTVLDSDDIDAMIGDAAGAAMDTDEDGEPIEGEKGDFPGHPFRGNQHAGGRAAGAHHVASRSAHLATVRANHSGGSVEHKAAANYHKRAAALHQKAGNAKMVAHHKDMAAQHMKIAHSAKSDSNSDAEKAAKTGQKALRSQLMDHAEKCFSAAKAYMDTYATAGEKAEADLDALKIAPPTPVVDVDAVAKAVIAVLDARDAEKASQEAEARKNSPEPESDRRPAVRAVPVSKEDDSASAGKVETVDARKAASEAPSPAAAISIIRRNPETFRVN